MRYVALLRVINVGGKNLIKMPALKLCFDSLGFTDVATIRNWNTTTALLRLAES